MSGGLDSAVTASIAAAESAALYLLHVTYGQRTEDRERAAFHALADHFRPAARLVVALPHLGQIGGSSLTDPNRPVESADLARTVIPSTYVPFRNAQILAAAVAWAEVLGAGAVYIGAVGEDGSGYPDCRPAFYHAFQRLVDTGVRPETRIRVRTPLIDLDKAAIVLKGVALGTPFALTWSCYRSGESPCGDCDSCALRRRGFARAGLADPIATSHKPLPGPAAACYTAVSPIDAGPKRQGG